MVRILIADDDIEKVASWKEIWEHLSRKTGFPFPVEIITFTFTDAEDNSLLNNDDAITAFCELLTNAKPEILIMDLQVSELPEELGLDDFLGFSVVAEAFRRGLLSQKLVVFRSKHVDPNLEDMLRNALPGISVFAKSALSELYRDFVTWITQLYAAHVKRLL